MVYTCNEWKKARSEKAYARTTYDMAMESSLIYTCGLLFNLQRARLSKKSFISKVSLANLNLIPAEILGFIPQDKKEDKKESERLQAKTISEVVPAKDIEKDGKNKLELSYGGLHQIFWEGARADFNGDGVEDVLIFTADKAEGGTMGYAYYFILTRYSSSGPLKLISQ